MAPHEQTLPTRHIAGHGTFATYFAGYALAASLTLAAFGTVMFHWLPPHPTTILITTAAIAQALTHMWFFLHMFRRDTPVWNTMSFAFTLFVVTILITGSLFILLTADQNMMPPMPPASLP